MSQFLSFPVNFVLLDFIIQVFEFYMALFVLIIGNSSVVQSLEIAVLGMFYDQLLYF